MTREPVVIIGIVVSLIEVALGLFPDWSPDTRQLIMTAVAALGTLLASFLSRQFVTPVADPRDNQGRSLKA